MNMVSVIYRYNKMITIYIGKYLESFLALYIMSIKLKVQVGLLYRLFET